MTDVPVRTFISYSWSSPTHEAWVENLASRLRQDGVDAILDKWDLQPGDDAYKFMERMVTDRSVSKVLMICDRKYSEKADRREGGVGAESQIISPELYGKSTQTKFAAAITEVDDQGEAFVPVFYKGRIHFDFSVDDKYEAQYEELLRWILGKQLKVKPALGAVPKHISEQTQSIKTESKYQRALAALKQNSANSGGYLKEFSEELAEVFEGLRLSGANKQNFDDEIVASINQGRPYVGQVIGLATAMARYSKDEASFEVFMRMIERLGTFMFTPPPNVGIVTSWDSDNYIYLCHEMFLVSFATFLKEERFDLADGMLTHAYLMDREIREGRATQSYIAFRPFVESLRGRNQRLKLNRQSVHADMLSASYQDHTLAFADLMQADFVLYLRDAIQSVKADSRPSWYPVTLLYSGRRFRPFEIFARSESKKYFDKFQRLLGVTSGDQLRGLIEKLLASNLVPNFDYQRLAIDRLSNAANVATMP